MVYALFGLASCFSDNGGDCIGDIHFDLGPIFDFDPTYETTYELVGPINTDYCSALFGAPVGFELRAITTCVKASDCDIHAPSLVQTFTVPFDGEFDGHFGSQPIPGPDGYIWAPADCRDIESLVSFVLPSDNPDNAPLPIGRLRSDCVVVPDGEFAELKAAPRAIAFASRTSSAFDFGVQQVCETPLTYGYPTATGYELEANDVAAWCTTTEATPAYPRQTFSLPCQEEPCAMPPVTGTAALIPGDDNWTTTAPYENVTLSNGDALWVYAPCSDAVAEVHGTINDEDVVVGSSNEYCEMINDVSLYDLAIKTHITVRSLVDAASTDFACP